MPDVRSALLRMKADIRDAHYMTCTVLSPSTQEDTETGTMVESYQNSATVRCRLEWINIRRDRTDRRASQPELDKSALLYTSDEVFPLGTILSVKNGNQTIGIFQTVEPTLVYTSHTVTPVIIYRRYA